MLASNPMLQRRLPHRRAACLARASLLATVCVATVGLLWATPALAKRTALRLPLQSAVPTIDPGLGEDTTSIELVEQLFLGLTDFDDRTMEVVPELAESWTASEDGRTYTFKLRKARWTDGRPVTAEDVVWAIRRNAAPATASPYAYMLYGIAGAEAVNKGTESDATKIGVSAPDASTVVITLANPAAYFPAVAGMWTLRPLPRWVIEKHGVAWTDPANIVTNGPYRLAEWKKGNEIVLRRNEDYTGPGKVSIAEIRYLIVPESSTGLAMYENGELDMMGTNYLPVPSVDIPRIKADPKLSQQLDIAPRLCTYYYGFNTARPPMDNVLVRKAFSAAINRSLLIERVVQGEEEPATTFTRPPIFGSVPRDAGVGIGYDPDQARRWLAEAGYPGGKGLPEVVLMFNTSENHGRIAQAIQQMWSRELGVQVKVQNQEWKVYLNTTKKPDGPHISRFGWCADYPDANNWLLEVFHPTKSTNRVQWHNEEFARITERAQIARDLDERRALYRRAEEILTQEQAVIAPIYFYTHITLTQPWLRAQAAPLGGNHLRDWTLEN